MKKLENKIVFITGGNSGIGKASALEAAREGATVVVAEPRKQRPQTNLRRNYSFGGKMPFCAD